MENWFSCFDASGTELEFDDGQDRKYDCDHTHNDDWCLDAFSCADDTSESIGKDTCLYFYAEKGGYFYEMDSEQAEEKILRLVEKNVVCEQVKKILTGD